MHLRLNRKSPLPIHIQLKAQLAHLIPVGEGGGAVSRGWWVGGSGASPEGAGPGRGVRRAPAPAARPGTVRGAAAQGRFASGQGSRPAGPAGSPVAPEVPGGRDDLLSRSRGPAAPGEDRLRGGGRPRR